MDGVFKEEARVPLKISHLVDALNTKKLSSKEIFESENRNKE